MLVYGSTTYGQRALKRQFLNGNPRYRSSTLQGQIRRVVDCTIGTRETLLLPMPGSPARALKDRPLECASMGLRWFLPWPPECSECSPAFLGPCVDPMPLCAVPSCPSRTPIPGLRAWQKNFPLQSTARLLAPVAFGDTGQCSAWGRYGNTCSFIDRWTDYIRADKPLASLLASVWQPGRLRPQPLCT